MNPQLLQIDIPPFSPQKNGGIGAPHFKQFSVPPQVFISPTGCGIVGIKIIFFCVDHDDESQLCDHLPLSVVEPRAVLAELPTAFL